MVRASCIALLVLAVGCEEADNGEPSLTGVAPAQVFVGVLPETVAVSGVNLFGLAASSLDDDPPFLDNEWTAALDDDPIDATWIDPTRIDAVVPAGTPVGVYDVVVTAPDGTVLRLSDAFTVSDEPIDLAISIEDAPGGAGTPIGDATLMVTDALEVHAVIYDDQGAFVQDAAVTWSVSGGIGDIDSGPSTSATFTATTEGQGVITGAHPTADDGTTGTITIEAGTAICETCLTGPCNDDCAADSCIYSCGDQCECTLGCIDVTGTCAVGCANVATCDVDCTGAARCAVDCTQRSNCTVTCDGADCSGAVCELEAVCEFDCTDATDCGGIVCSGDAECLLDCTGADPCEFAVCGGPETSCPDDVIVCNRLCP